MQVEMQQWPAARPGQRMQPVMQGGELHASRFQR
jgi:hypothetical protein